jgi:hypothetical protein
LHICEEMKGMTYEKKYSRQKEFICGS